MVLTSDQIRKAEQNAVEYGMSWLRLMENAGSAAVRVIRKSYKLEGKNIVIICGKGNNGGDGYVIARKFLDDNANIRIISVEPAATVSAKEMLSKAMSLGLRPIDFDSYRTLCCQYISNADFIIDAMFGTGFRGVPEGVYCAVIDAVNRSSAIKISIDIPSGMWSDTGELNSLYVHSDMTVTFAAYKPCHLLYPSNGYCGKVVVVPIGMPEESFIGISPVMDVVTDRFVIDRLPVRDVNYHKGLCGTAGLFVGSKGFAGAAVIAAKSAIKSGVGIANIILPDSVYNIVGISVPEAVCTVYDCHNDGCIDLKITHTVAETLSGCSSGLIGCGLGQSKHTEYTIKEILKKCNIPLVIDADGINVLADSIDLIKQYRGGVVITPHPKEASRLLRCSVDQIQADRLGNAKKLAELTGAVTVLKGANTIIALPDGKCHIITDGNPGMATAGTGDMLAGMIVSFLAQGLDLADAAVVAAKLHAMSGDTAVKTTSVLSLTPTDMLEALPEILLTMYLKK